MLCLWAARALTPDRELARVAVRIEAGRIAELVADAEPDPGAERFPDATLVPGLVDLQVNGGNCASSHAGDPPARTRATAFPLRPAAPNLLRALANAPS